MGTIMSGAVLLGIVIAYGGTSEEADAILVRLRDGKTDYPRLPSETETLILGLLSEVRNAAD